jgi:hypothetical protein
MELHETLFEMYVGAIENNNNKPQKRYEDFNTVKE